MKKFSKMKKMKKAGIIFCAGVMAFGMAGCKGQVNKEEQGQDVAVLEEVADNEIAEEDLADKELQEGTQENQEEVQEETSKKTQEEAQGETQEEVQEEAQNEDSENQETKGAETTETGATDNKTLLTKVLKGEKTFVYTKEEGKEITISQLAYNENTPFEPIQYAIVDMDGDGKSEVVVELSSAIDGAYEVFHVIGDKVYGYETVFRAMSKLYEGGYCMGSNGASSWDIYKMSFSESGYTTNNIAGCVDGTYYLNGNDNVAEEEYQQFVDENLKVVTWYDMSTVEEKLSQMAETTSTKQLATNKNEKNTLVKASGQKVIADSKVQPCALQKNTNAEIESSMANAVVTLDFKTDGYIFPDADSEVIKDGSLKYLPKEVLRYARNEIYARHGYIFTSSEMETFFKSKLWYKGTTTSEKWSDSVLNKYEKKNLKKIKKYENKKNTAKALKVKKSGKVLKVSDGDFTLTLPEAWTKDSFFVDKNKIEDRVIYSFYEKNNYIYGAYGYIFSLEKLKEGGDKEFLDFSDSVIKLGKSGGYEYFMTRATDVEYLPKGALMKKYTALENGYEAIGESFKTK